MSLLEISRHIIDAVSLGRVFTRIVREALVDPVFPIPQSDLPMLPSDVCMYVHPHSISCDSNICVVIFWEYVPDAQHAAVGPPRF